MSRVVSLTVALLLFAGSLPALSEVATFAEKQERSIAERVSREKFPLRKLQMEYLLRQGYTLRLEEMKERTIRSGRLSTPEIETLKAERQALVDQLKALDGKITEASAKAPEIEELKAVLEANEKRIAAIRETLAPELNSNATESKVTE